MTVLDFKSWLKQSDADGDGRISKQEIKEAISGLGLCKAKKQMTVEEFKKWLKEHDTDGDGRISKEELRAAMRSLGLWYSVLPNSCVHLPSMSIASAWYNTKMNREM
ncbi:hypothetical protein IFM89_001965 [Coptis chinensis]|uniref:EF-hand domain-containing protein n=1 Tax=Coptis chinensis TaxID=261450 RepID=A0A835HG15_9MAGN|nr:hypothetical protein IFM89_001965 [Coptis chinensis]